jgi:hypothetical protein
MSRRRGRFTVGSSVRTRRAEPAQVLPTAGLRPLAGEATASVSEHSPARKPFPVDRCPALRVDVDVQVVRRRRPPRIRQPDANKSTQNHDRRAPRAATATPPARSPGSPFASTLQGDSP